ncbi:MAG: hypothetical protein ACFB9N_05600 [Geitlerinemataceae cyanobacterium]
MRYFFSSVSLALVGAIASAGLTSSAVAEVSESPAARRLTVDATCQLGSTIERNRRLEVSVPQRCLDDRLGLSQLLADARDRANEFAQSAGSVPLEVRSIAYQPIVGGLQVSADLGIDNPFLGFLDFRVVQDVIASVDSGKLSLEAGATRLVMDVPIFGGGDLEGIARGVVDRQLQVLNGKRLSELTVETGLDRIMAERSGLSREAVNFIVASVEDDIDIAMTASGAIVTVEFR